MLDRYFLLNNFPKGSNQKAAKHHLLLSVLPHFIHTSFFLSRPMSREEGPHVIYLLLSLHFTKSSYIPSEKKKRKKKLLGYSTLEIQISVKIQRNTFLKIVS